MKHQNLRDPRCRNYFVQLAFFLTEVAAMDLHQTNLIDWHPVFLAAEQPAMLGYSLDLSAPPHLAQRIATGALRQFDR